MLVPRTRSVIKTWVGVLGVVEGVGWIHVVGTGRSPSELLIVLKMWDDPQPCTKKEYTTTQVG